MHAQISHLYIWLLSIWEFQKKIHFPNVTASAYFQCVSHFSMTRRLITNKTAVRQIPMLRIFPFLKIKTRFRSGLFNEKSSQAIILPVLQLAKGQIYYLLTSSHYLLGNYTSSFCVSIFDLLLLSSVCISQKTNNKSPVLVLYRNCMRDKLVLWPVAICTSLFDYLVLLSPSCLHYFT